MNIPRLVLAATALAGALPLVAATSFLPAEPVSLDDLSAFVSPGENWTLASGIGGDPRREKAIAPIPGHGVLINTAPPQSGENLFTAWDHSDIELDLDFLMPAGSNSGIYLQGRYEVQLFDSWGVAEPSFSDCGGIYQRWIEREKRGYEGVAPRANASRAPGLWQHLHIVFQAPRFDAAGNKIENARFIEVALNGSIIHENVEVTGPTRASPHTDEVARAPLMIQGDHGPVAFRNITVKHFNPGAAASLFGLECSVRRGENLTIGDIDTLPADMTPAVDAIDPSSLGVPNNFAATYTGRIQLPATGTYAFHASGEGPIRLIIDDQTVIVPLSPGGRTIPAELTAGTHTLRLDYVHGQWRKPGLTLAVEGPGLRLQTLTPQKKSAKKNQRSHELVIEPTDGRVRVQRSFVPYEPRKRLYAINVGSPSGLHYAYDFDTAALLRVWRGRFLDTFEMWDGRGHNQIAKPAGPAFTLPNKPTVALLETTGHDWPDQPDALWSPQGYTFENDGQPVFLARLSDLEVTDRIAADPQQHGFHRTLRIKGRHTSWWTGVLLAEAARIAPDPGGTGYIIGDREHYIDLPANNPIEPFVRSINGHDQLIVLIPSNEHDVTLDYTLVW